ncbi:Ubiquinone biosynthesis protein Coq7 [Rickettsia prowazekii str. GvF12]|nr:Ubiquinone biosynthesis protein Coq7 [Rickettsia prowazekii str. GvF12]
MPRPDFSNLDKQIHDIIRVNHAGEYGAKRIYEGQLTYIKSKNDRILIKEMLDHEVVHLNFFEKNYLKEQSDQQFYCVFGIIMDFYLVLYLP